MHAQPNLTAIEEQQGRALLLFMVVIGLAVTFLISSNSGVNFTFPQLVLGVACGVIYLILGVFDAEIFGRFSKRTRNVLFFSIQIALVFGVGWLLGPGGNWMIGVPLAGMAVERLPPRWRWLVYLALLGTVVLPIGLRYSTWRAALINGIIISTAIFFVTVFTQFRLNEHRARERAEELARRLEEANRRLAEYVSQAEELAATQERNRLAREIHDNLGHYLTIVNVQIEAARLTLNSEPARAADALVKAQSLAQKGLASVRESVSALRVSPMENRSLSEALAALIEETQCNGVSTNLTVMGEPHSVDERSALVLYRAAQEGLTNVCKHANATHVDLTLDFSQPEQIRLSLQDDGYGAADINGGFGLVGIRERVHLLGGEFNVKTEPGKGFRLEVSVPVAG
ncbi:MAG: sensor histidine kinase [Chloroflexi bacterium]|nr:sensor histidine kinase [Chloroflexota bacterium]